MNGIWTSGWTTARGAGGEDIHSVLVVFVVIIVLFVRIDVDFILHTCLLSMRMRMMMMVVMMYQIRKEGSEGRTEYVS